jgi:hypothetical protein
MSEETPAKVAQVDEAAWPSKEDMELRAIEFQSALIDCGSRNEFVTAYLAALAEKIETLRPLYKAACPVVVLQWQCAAFLVACGKENLPIAEAVQTLREFVQFLDDGLVHWR